MTRLGPIVIFCSTMVVAADRCPVGEGDDSDRENP